MKPKISERELMLRMTMLMYEHADGYSTNEVLGVIGHVFVSAIAVGALQTGRMTKLEARDNMHKHLDLIFDEVWNVVSTTFGTGVAPKTLEEMEAAVAKMRRRER